MEEMTKKDFFKEYWNENNYPSEWDFSLFKIQCVKCSSTNVEINGKIEEDRGYYDEVEIKLKIWTKCHDCGSFMGVREDSVYDTIIENNTH